jgi:hypothetical protein
LQEDKSRRHHNTTQHSETLWAVESRVHQTDCCVARASAWQVLDKCGTAASNTACKAGVFSICPARGKRWLKPQSSGQKPAPGWCREAFVVDDHLCPHQPQPQLQWRAGQLVSAEVGRFIAVVSTAPGQGDAGGGVAGATLAAPVDGPASAKHSMAQHATAQHNQK